MEIELYDEAHRRQFEDLFVNYFTLDFHAPFSEAMIRSDIVPKYVDRSVRGVAPLLMAFEDGEPIGFINFQIDSEASNWNERPGWGMIRELHVAQAWRRRGVGSVLADIATRVMKESGATRAYLTTEDTFDFWEALGWEKTDEMAPNGGIVMEKTL